MVGVDRFRTDPTYRRVAGGSIVLGGTPLRLFRLTTAGQRIAAAIERGDPLPAGHHKLTDRLSEAGAIQPVPAGGRFTEADVTVVMPAFGFVPLTAPDQAVAATIVVDDAGPAAFAAPTGATLVRRATNGGPGAARNTGLDMVTTPLVAFLDADVSARPGWMTELLPHFEDERLALVAPRVRSAPAPGRIAAYERDRSPLDLGQTADHVHPGGRISYVPSTALLCRVEVLQAMEGFDESLRVGEDVDLVWRLNRAGWRCRYEPAASVDHRPRATVRALLRQRVSYGTSAAPLAERHPGAAPPLRISPWTAAVWALLGVRRPAAAALVAAGTAVALQRKLRGVPATLSWRLAIGGHARAAVPIAAAVRRTWWPIALATALVSRRTRIPLAAATLPLIGAYRRTDRKVPAPAWVALAVADDAAYGWGVWRGVISRRRLDALAPGYRSAR